jgi:hypothetical protein
MNYFIKHSKVSKNDLTLFFKGFRKIKLRKQIQWRRH